MIHTLLLIILWAVAIIVSFYAFVWLFTLIAFLASLAVTIFGGRK